jgi:dephospho-CoA kinase
MATQLPRAARLACADDVIDNSGPPEALGPQIERLDHDYRARAAVQSSDHAGRIRAQ